MIIVGGSARQTQIVQPGTEGFQLVVEKRVEIVVYSPGDQSILSQRFIIGIADFGQREMFAEEVVMLQSGRGSAIEIQRNA